MSKTIKKSAQASVTERREAIEVSQLNSMTWISAEQVINQVEDEASTDDTRLTSVSWAMSAADLTVVDSAREWFKSSSLAQRRTYSHGYTSVKANQKRRERSIKGYHPLCQTVNDNIVSYPYL